MGLFFILCIIFLYFPFYTCGLVMDVRIIVGRCLFIGKSLKTYWLTVSLDWHRHLSLLVFINIFFHIGDIRSKLTKHTIFFHSKGHPLPTPFTHSSILSPTVFPHRCAEGMERMCCWVGLRFACSFSCPVLPWFQQRMLQLQSTLKFLFNSLTLWHISSIPAPQHVACLFPRQLISRQFGISELN